MTRRPTPETSARKPATKSATNDAPGTPRIFISYSHKDSGALARLVAHLATLKRGGVEIWIDENILPGHEIDREIPRALKQANIFIAMVSPDYMASKYCFETEYRYALGRRERQTMSVVAAIIRPCDWKQSPMARYKALPRDGKSVIEWPHQDMAYADIVQGIRRVVGEVSRGELKPIGRRVSAMQADKRPPTIRKPLPKIAPRTSAKAEQPPTGSRTKRAAASKKVTASKRSGSTKPGKSKPTNGK
ncbi:toll/interleukin-1 receptor domain-containing protein [Aurantimonas endophytica]|uniref:toll/interleukin-1 receptor domain-containing protein n=1 Tax=Aurantimonas endophytica TaxID=1522175 RepID=UPI003AB94AA5